MPSTLEKNRERKKQWRKDNPDLYKAQRKRHREKHAKANYEKLKKWRQENPELRKAQKQRERRRKQKPENQFTSPLADYYEFVDSSSPDPNDILEALFPEMTPSVPEDQPLTDFYCSKEVEAFVDNMVAHIPLEIIKFDCTEFLNGPSSTENFDMTPSGSEV